VTAIGISELLLVTIDSFYNPQGAKLLITYLKNTNAASLRIVLSKNTTVVFDKTVDVSAQSVGTEKTYVVDLTATDLSNIASTFQLTNIDSFIDMDFPWKQSVNVVSPGNHLELKNDSGADKIVQGLATASYLAQPSSGTVDLVLVDPAGNEYKIASKSAANQAFLKFEIFGLLPNGWAVRVKNQADTEATVELYLHDNTPATWATDTGTLQVEELDANGNVLDRGQATVTVKVANMQKKVLEADAILLAGIKSYKIPLQSMQAMPS